MNYLLVIISIIAGLYIFFRIKRNIIKHTAAMNALVAKITYQQLDIDLQKQVIDRTIFIIQRDGRYSTTKERIDKMKDREKFGFFALAMLELDIKPFSPKWKWYPIKNPFAALIGAEKEIKMAQAGLKEEGFEVSLSD